MDGDTWSRGAVMKFNHISDDITKRDEIASCKSCDHFVVDGSKLSANYDRVSMKSTTAGICSFASPRSTTSDDVCKDYNGTASAVQLSMFCHSDLGLPKFPFKQVTIKL